MQIERRGKKKTPLIHIWSNEYEFPPIKITSLHEDEKKKKQTNANPLTGLYVLECMVIQSNKS